MKIVLGDLKILIPVISSVFLAGVFIQENFIGKDRIRDAVENCNSELRVATNELKLAEKYIAYLEADSGFNRNQTYENKKISDDKRIILEQQLSVYPIEKSLKDKTLVDKFSQLKEIKKNSVKK